MASNTYELDWTRYYVENRHYTSIAILTGLPLEEIAAASPESHYWGGQRFVEVFRRLGFNVNPRWKKFDPETEYPCLIRFKAIDSKEPYWYQTVYYDGKIQDGNAEWEFHQWKKYYSNYKITSMLQVWI